MQQPVISVILPTYNEAQNVPILIERLEQVFSNAGIAHEVLVVDDNSPDGTWRVAEEISLQKPNVRCIRRLNERGLSSAVVTGMTAAKGRCLAVMDADLQHDEKILPDMIRCIDDEGFDLVVGSRGVDGGSYGEFSKRRRFMSWGAALLAKLLLPVNVKDPMSGFFLVTRKLFTECVERINPVGFKILLEFIGRNPGLKVKEVGYTFQLRRHGETKLSGSVIRNYLIALYDMRFGKYLSSTFMMYAFVGCTGVVVNLGGFALGEFLQLPRFNTGIFPMLDPMFLSVPFGIQLSIITNYVLNNYITFYEQRHRGALKLLRGLLLFQLISMLGLIIQWSVFQLLHTNGFLSSLVYEGLRSYLNNAIGIVVATVSNYYLNVNVTWGVRGKPSA